MLGSARTLRWRYAPSQRSDILWPRHAPIGHGCQQRQFTSSPGWMPSPQRRTVPSSAMCDGRTRSSPTVHPDIRGPMPAASLRTRAFSPGKRLDLVARDGADSPTHDVALLDHRLPQAPRGRPAAWSRAPARADPHALVEARACCGAGCDSRAASRGSRCQRACRLRGMVRVLPMPFMLRRNWRSACGSGAIQRTVGAHRRRQQRWPSFAERLAPSRMALYGCCQWTRHGRSGLPRTRSMGSSSTSADLGIVRYRRACRRGGRGGRGGSYALAVSFGLGVEGGEVCLYSAVWYQPADTPGSRSAPATFAASLLLRIRPRLGNLLALIR